MARPRFKILLLAWTFGAVSHSREIAPFGRAAAAPAAAAERSAHPREGEPARAGPRIRWIAPQADGCGAAVEVAGIDADDLRVLKSPGMSADRWVAFLPVRVVRVRELDADPAPPLWGSYRVAGETLRFEPRFPLEPGVRYRAEMDPAELRAVVLAMTPRREPAAEARPVAAARLTAEFALPQRPAQPSTRVRAVVPTRSVLPENLLRFYIHFSAPMSRGEAYRHLRLLDATGRPVDTPFLELDEELWSRDGTRFTLLFDPGRIKRGLRPREELGPILEAGKSYKLVIDRGWTDATGRPLTAGFGKVFRAGPPDETSPDPKTWSIRPPRAQTREPLEVHFPEPLDRALLDRLIAVEDAAAKTVRGQVSVIDEETTWGWTPDQPWRPGTYRLVIGTELEDIAGNNLARPFEVDLEGPISRRVTADSVSLPFRIGPPPR